MIAGAAFVIAASPRARAQALPAAAALPAAPDRASRSVVFIHAGGAPKTGGQDQPIASRIARDLVKFGYIVRAPDQEQDSVGGPGIDYFADSDLPLAQHVALVVNAALVDAYAAAHRGKPPVLAPRRQSAKNPPGYLGVWLFPATAS
ncbi:MAG TPA: hypothetical protein VHS58_15545 [Acetobacteraceae bacterium]|jgi:hypothetical protein|nr:hypothetical protein [Acetobacteraceae bacterium]